MIFTEMKAAIIPLMEKIYSLPFNRELSLGILEKDIFIFYLSQDILYLADYAKAFAMTAARLTNNNHTLQFIRFSHEAIQAERKLHLGWMENHPVLLEQSPFCFMYTNYLLKMASHAPVEEAVASLLPCFFIYYEVGKKMLAHQECPGVNPYQEWINLYSSEEFYSSLQIAIEIVNELGDLASCYTKKNMISAFIRSTQLEFNFWKSAYCKEKWEL